jgi:alpha-N-arabinofuranosidase
VSLDIFNRHADRVRMANIAQTINVLQAMILTEGDRMALTPTYHVFELYTVHHDAVLLPLTFEGAQPRYEYQGQSIPAVSGSASRDKEGRIHITLTNLDPNRGRTVSGEITGAHVSRVSGRVLTAAAMNAHNTFDQPTAVQPAPFSGARVSGDKITVDLPPKSVVLVELQ